MTYIIKDWDINYENNRTRGMKSMQWVPFPNAHDGDGFTQLMSEKDGTALFGAWVLVVQVASKCHPRGTLLRSNGHPHDFASLSRMTRGDEKIIQKAVKILLKIGWIDEIDSETPKRQEGAGCPHPTDDLGKEGKEGKAPAQSLANRLEKFQAELKNFTSKYPPKMLNKFYEYWTETNRSKTKMKWEMQSTWDLSRRLARWSRNNFDKKSSDNADY